MAETYNGYIILRDIPYMNDLNQSQQFCSIATILICVLGCFDFGISYGKLKSHYLKLEFNPRISWILFEIPNLIAFLIVFASDYSLKIIENPMNYLLILPFLIHYVNRAIIYPLKTISSNKKVPIEIILSAMFFTSCNGYLQSSYLLSKENALNFSDLNKL